MAWIKVAEETTRTHRSTWVHVIWRCWTCKAWAVTGGSDPGVCWKCKSKA